MRRVMELEGKGPSLDRLRAAVADWGLGDGVASRLETTYLDTFDWRLHRKGLRLTHDVAPGDAVLELRLGVGGVQEGPADAGGVRPEPWHAAGHTGGASTATRLAEVPAFARDLPDGEPGETVRAAAGSRRLFTVATVERDRLRFPVRDELGKLVAHLEVDRRLAPAPPGGLLALTRDPCESGSPPAATALDGGESPGPRSLPTTLQVVPLKGFENAAAAIAELLRSALGPLPPDGDELLDALGVWRLQPAAHGARWLPEVGPDEPADHVVGLFLGALLESVERNTPGLRADLDIEFLHDVRVALRRTRSLLRELAAEPAVAATAPLEEELAWLAGRSGACRDLDVLAETLPRYLEELSDDRRSELDPLAARVRLRRDASHRRLLADLASSRADAIFELWRRRAAALRDSAGGRQIGEVADERILAAARRALERASALDEESPDAKIHRLRIHCKRLRYLLEFFRGLYPTDRVDPVIVTLRRLQDRLGRFQDLCVHTELLRETALTPGPEPPMDADALLATGALLAGLDRRKERQRRRVLKALDRFLDEESLRVARLLGERP